MAAHSQAPLGARLRHLRRHRGLTLARLATRATVAIGTVHAIESGQRCRPRIDTLQRLAAALGVGAGYFL